MTHLGRFIVLMLKATFGYLVLFVPLLVALGFEGKTDKEWIPVLIFSALFLIAIMPRVWRVTGDEEA